MTKSISCGILILNEENEIFLAHVTGSTHWDIPKGMADPGESPLATALRETFEETGLRLEPQTLIDLGLFDYRPDKELHLFKCVTRKAELALASCRCTSFFMHAKTGASLPEVNAFRWVPIVDVPQYCAKNMGRLLKTIFGLVT